MSGTPILTGSLEVRVRVGGETYTPVLETINYQVGAGAYVEFARGGAREPVYSTEDSLGFTGHSRRRSLAEVVVLAEGYTHLELTFSVRTEWGHDLEAPELGLPLEIAEHIREMVEGTMVLFSVTGVFVLPTLEVKVTLERSGAAIPLHLPAPGMMQS
jgi:hypothetical protein